MAWFLDYYNELKINRLNGCYGQKLRKKDAVHLTQLIMYHYIVFI